MACNQLIGLSSADGAKLLNDVQAGCHGCCCQSKLISIFTKQRLRYSCGLVSCALVMSAYRLDLTPLSKPAFTEENIMSMPATLSVISQQRMAEGGLVHFYGLFLPERRLLCACISHRRVSVCVFVCVSVCHTPVLYQNG